MAHTCPTCASICHCNGDIDDLCFGEAKGYCSCCEDESDLDDYDPEEDWDDDDPNDSRNI